MKRQSVINLIASSIFIFTKLCQLLQHWEVLPRDNTTRIDAINVLRCLAANGFDDDTLIGIEGHCLALLLDGDDETGGLYSKSYRTNSIHHCLSQYSNDLSFVVIHYPDPFPEETTIIGELVTLQDADTTFPYISRMTREEQPFVMGGDMTVHQRMQLREQLEIEAFNKNLLGNPDR